MAIRWARSTARSRPTALISWAAMATPGAVIRDLGDPQFRQSPQTLPLDGLGCSPAAITTSYLIGSHI